MTTRSNSIARRWFLIVGLLVAVFVVAVAAIVLWPDDGRLVAVNAEANAEANAEQNGATNGATDEEADANGNADDQRVGGNGWFSMSQASAGAEAYAQHCSQCHGIDLEGGTGPALAEDTFWQRWGGETVHAFFEVTRQTMPQGDPGSLSIETYADITAHVLHVNGFQPGESDLPPEADHLQTLVIERSATEPDEADANGEEPAEADANGEDADANGADEAAEDGDGDADGASVNGWFTEDQAERGSEPYAQHCAQCHGEDLQGDPPLVGEQFHGRFDTVWDLFDYTRTQMPQGDPGSLDDETYADITAFVLRENDVSAGDEELEADDEDGMREMSLDASDAENGEAEDADAENGEAEDADAENGEAEEADAERDGPEPGRAWLELDTQPANVTINVIGPGGFTGRAIGAQTLRDLRPGLYVIAASRGHQSVMTTVVLGSGETGTVSLVLDELSRSADVPTAPGTGEAEVPAIPRRPSDEALIGEAPSAMPDRAPTRDDDADDRDAEDGDTERDQDQDLQRERPGLHMREVTQARDDGSDVRPGGQLQSERGQHAYALHCARCHGVDLEGNVAPALGGEVFLERWQGHPVDWLYFQARASMPPHGPGTLSEQTYADIIVFALTEAGVLDGHEGFRPNDETFRMLTIAPRGAALEDRSDLQESVERLRETLHEPHDGVAMDDTVPLSPIEWPDDLGTAPVGYPGRLDAAAATEVDPVSDDQDDEDDDEDDDEEDANARPAAQRSAGTG